MRPYTMTPSERVAVLKDQWQLLTWTPKQRLAYEAVRRWTKTGMTPNTPGTIMSGWIQRWEGPDVSDGVISKVLRRLGFLYYRAKQVDGESSQYRKGAWSCSGLYEVQMNGLTYTRVWGQDDLPAKDFIDRWLQPSDLVAGSVDESPERYETHCLVCKTRITQTPKGRKRSYCSGPCRQKAYRQRAPLRNAPSV
jgi:hypothetical protein